MTSKSDKFLIPPVSPAAGGPLYEQIVEAVKREICNGRIKPGQPLPSFRSLAEQLLVSVITVKRAYEELEREGIIYRRQGLGTFVSENGAARSRKAKLKNATDLFKEAVSEARGAGMGDEEIMTLLQDMISDKKGD